MKLILAGGGNAQQSLEVDTFFHELLSPKKILFLAQAISPEIWSFEAALQWLRKQNIFDDCKIEVWEDCEYKKLDEFMDFGAIYLMGGNTFKLIDFIRKENLDYVFREFFNDSILYGISAGAIVLGQSIKTAEIGDEKDENYLNISDYSGLNYLKNHVVVTHFTERMDGEVKRISQLMEKKIIAIPETSGLFVNDDNATVIGRDSIFLYDNLTIKEYFPKSSFEI